MYRVTYSSLEEIEQCRRHKFGPRYGGRWHVATLTRAAQPSQRCKRLPGTTLMATHVPEHLQMRMNTRKHQVVLLKY